MSNDNFEKLSNHISHTLHLVGYMLWQHIRHVIMAAHAYVRNAIIFYRGSFFLNAVLGGRRTEPNYTLPYVRKWARFENGRQKFGVPPL